MTQQRHNISYCIKQYTLYLSINYLIDWHWHSNLIGNSSKMSCRCGLCIPQSCSSTRPNMSVPVLDLDLESGSDNEQHPDLPTVPLLEGLSLFLSFQKWKEGQFHFLEISVMANFTVRTSENDGYFTSAFSLGYCDKFSDEKPFLNHKSVPNLNFVNVSVFGNVHAHGFGPLSHFLTLVGWQVWQYHCVGAIYTLNTLTNWKWPNSTLYIS